MSNSLDPNQAQLFVWPDLGPNYLQKYQQMTLVGEVLKLYAPVNNFQGFLKDSHGFQGQVYENTDSHIKILLPMKKLELENYHKIVMPSVIFFGHF